MTTDKQQATVQYLRENRAHNWVWPGGDEHWDGELQRNCWDTGLEPKGPNSKRNGIELLGTQPYFGPSKRTLKRRKARRGLRTAEASQLAHTKVMA